MVCISSKPLDPRPPRASPTPQDEIADALERLVAGPEKKGAVVSESKRRLVAYHEGGHALVRGEEGERRLSGCAQCPVH